MIEVQAEVYKRLVADATLPSLLDGYGVVPAIFSVPVPHNYIVSTLPSVLVDYPLASTDVDTYTEEYREVDLRVRLYGKPDPSVGGTERLNLAANAARNALKTWSNAAVTGGEIVSATVSGPVDAPTTDPTNAGRLLNVRLLVKEA